MPEQDEVNHVARVLMEAWEEAEGKPVTPSYVATFADMARAVLADREAHAEHQYGVAKTGPNCGKPREVRSSPEEES